MVSFILEAGLPTEILEAEVRAMAAAAEKAGVAVVGGDTKVVEHGKADHMYISTTGVGAYLPNIRPSVRPGDKVLLSGPIGDHGITILLARGELDLEADLTLRHALGIPFGGRHGASRRTRYSLDARSDSRRRGHLAQRTGSRLRARHSSQRGRNPGTRLREGRLRVAGPGSTCTLPTKASSWRWWLRSMLTGAQRVCQAAGGADAVILGEIHPQPAGSVLVTTRYGGSRIVDMLVGDPLPRIC